MGEKAMGRSAHELQRGAIAIVDSAGNVTWTDEAWMGGNGESGLPPVPIGANLLQAYRGYSDSRAQAVANAIEAVFEGKATYFEIEHRAGPEGESSFLTSVAALRGDGIRAVVIHRLLSGRESTNHDRLTRVRATDGGFIGNGAERMTPREREVLTLMAVGLDNRAIAARLGIQYTTVRGHVRSVIEKLDARSRLEAVARAYQKGLVPT
jgi:DNA-binding NarL/FixJ family response regulator